MSRLLSELVPGERAHLEQRVASLGTAGGLTACGCCGEQHCQGTKGRHSESGNVFHLESPWTLRKRDDSLPPTPSGTNPPESILRTRTPAPANSPNNSF